jgi:Peptidase family M23
VRGSAALLVLWIALCAPAGAGAYSWPLKPFDRAHAIRGAFGDPRYHLDVEGQVSAFHFGVDIAAPDGAAVYAVEPGYVHARSASVAVESASGRLFGYWHIRPVVRTGQHVRRHQLLGRVGAGWGHLHFAESFHGAYKNPLRPGALTPFFDHNRPTVDSIELLSPDGTPLDPSRVVGPIDLVASIYEVPPIAPPAPWQGARLTPAVIWWVLSGPDGASASDLVADFAVGLPPNALYSWVYAPGSYQNKADRPGKYLFWLAHGLDTTAFPDGRYRLTVYAENTRRRIGDASISFVTANGVSIWLRTQRPRPGRPQPR